MPTGSSAESTPSGQPVPKRRGEGGFSWPRFLRNALLIGLSVVVVSVFVVRGVVPNLVPKNFGVVEEGRLYRSGELTTAALRSVIEEHGIRTVIDFGAHDHDPEAERREQAVTDLLGVKRHVLYLHGDGRGDPNRYLEALRIMSDPEQGPVLVHCAAGAQRTGCAVALYRSLVQGWDDDRALGEAGEYRHDPEDNPKMPEMYRTWRDEIERAFERGGAVEYTLPPGAVPAGPRPSDPAGAGG